jgi:hypothetical protein
LTIRPGTNDIGQLMRKSLMAFAPGIIGHICTIIIQDGLFPATIFETMQMDLYTRSMQATDLVKEIENSPVIHGVGHVQANDM